VLLYVATNGVFTLLKLPEELFTRGITPALYMNGYLVPRWLIVLRLWPQIAIWKAAVHFGVAWAIARTHRPLGIAIVVANLAVIQASAIVYLWSQIPYQFTPVEQMVFDLMVVYPIAFLTGGVRGGSDPERESVLA
jgi:hypothetical protein